MFYLFVLRVLFLYFSAECVFSNLLWVVSLPLYELHVCELLNPRLHGECLNLLQDQKVRSDYLFISWRSSTVFKGSADVNN